MIHLAAPKPVRLGPSDRHVQPLTKVTRESFETPLGGPAFLYGSALGGRRPSAPGMTGDLLVAIDSPYQIFGRSASYIHVAAWRTNGQPAAGARIYVNRKPVGRTDVSGTLVFAHKPANKNNRWDRNTIFAVDAAKRCGAVSFNPYERTKTFSTDRLFVYTDRGVFQPGETMHTRIIGWRLKHDYAPLASADVELLLRDDAGHSIAAATGKTDAFGITAVDLPIPLTAAMGDYHLRVAYGQERASTRIQIRRFDPPAFRAQHTLPRFLTRQHKGPLAFSLTLHPPASETLGKLDIEATAKAPDGSVIATVKRSAQGNGPHALKLAAADVKKLIKATREGQLARVELRAQDELGRDVQLARELNITARPYSGVLELDRDVYSTGEPVAVVARIGDLDSVPLRRKQVQLRVGTSKKLLTAKTDAAGMARFALKMPSASTKLALMVNGIKVADSSLSWRAPRPMRTELASPVIKERQRTEVVARFPAGFEPAAPHVHMDMVDTSGGIVGSTLLRVSRDSRGYYAHGKFKAPSWGSMLLSFFTIGRKSTHKKKLGLLVAGQSLVVQTDRQLEITLEGLPRKMRPGDPLAVRAHVKTATGKPADVSLGAALVNRNVLSLKDPLEITPMDRFYNPELRTLVTTGSKILTWPVVSRNWGRTRHHDIALPPFNWQEGGDLLKCERHWDEEDWKASGKKPPVELGTVGTIGHGFGSGHGGLGGRHKTFITIRTRFPATALWAPHLRGKGTVDIKGRLPDTIGEQELIVVASDKQGGVGVVRQAVDVSQPVFVQAAVPSPAVAGETVQIPAIVRNSTKQDSNFAVKLSGPVSQQTRNVTVASGGVGAIDVPVKLDRTGKVQLQVRAMGAGHDDRAIRDITVVPRGVPVGRIQHAALLPNQPLELKLTIDPQATGADAHLRLEFPAVTSAFANLPQLAATIRDDPWGLSSDLASAGIVLQLADRFRLNNAETKALRGRLFAALSMAQRVQRKSGGFGYWRNGKTSPLITGRVLDGMLEAKAAGVPVPDKSIDKAAGFIGNQLDSGDLVSLQDIGWWEGRKKRVREGVTAELFAILSRLPKRQRKGVVHGALVKLTKRYRKYLTRPDIDTLTAGHALTALLRLKAIDKNKANGVMARLMAVRDRGHWEPSWFHAYGGRIDATAAVLQALQLQDPVGRQADKRDALSWILSTRASWGDWHAEAATAAALRAMLLAGAAPSEVASTVTVLLDGKTMKTVVVDPADPWKSTAALAHLDLGSLSAGQHKVTIRYDGKLKPALSLVSRQWLSGNKSTLTQGGLRISTSGPSSAQAGSRIDLVVNAAGTELAGGSLLIGNSSLLQLDLGKLGTLTGFGRPIANVQTSGDNVALTLSPTAKSLAIALPWLVTHRGQGHLPTIAVFPRKGAPLIAAPGPLNVK